jgi:hypothetical protein
VVHGTSSPTETLTINGSGLVVAEGRPEVSTNLAHARDWTTFHGRPDQAQGDGERGTVLVCAVPPNFHIGYGIFTTAYIDRAMKRVSGAPLRYAAARKQLALYVSADTEAARLHIESEIANGFPMEQHDQYTVDPKYIVGSFVGGPVFDSVISELDVAVRSLQMVEFDRLESMLAGDFRASETDDVVMIPTIIRDLLIGTIESLMISRLRMMRWQGLSLLGYTFNEGKQAVQVPPVSSHEEQRKRMDELGRQLASSGLFTAELAWLRTYGAHELELMRVELDGAELDT